MDEEPVVAVGGRIAQRLAGDREHAGALLARRLGDQLLEPQPDALQRRGQDERQLVAALGVLGGDHVRERLAGVDAELVVALRDRLGGALQERRQVDARERGRDEPERRERGVAPADVGAAVRDARPAVAARALLERRARVGDRDEARAVAAGLAPERIGEAVGLHRRARFGRDHEERALHRARRARRPGRSSRARAGAGCRAARRSRAERGSIRPCRTARCARGSHRAGPPTTAARPGRAVPSSTASIQPSHRSSPEFVQSEASRANRRATSAPVLMLAPVPARAPCRRSSRSGSRTTS